MEIENYEDYLIYADGRVFSKISNIFLKAYINNRGYYKVMLYKNGILKNFKVHRLIAIHYIQNNDPNKFIQVNHINCNKTDNRIENLEWCTNLYNTQSKNTTKNVGCVYFKTDYKRTKPYQAQIRINKVLHRKYFKTEVEGRTWLTTF